MSDRPSSNQGLAPLVPHLKRHWPLLAAIVVCIILVVLSSVLASSQMGAAIDAGLAGDLPGFWRCLLWIVGARLMMAATHFLRTAAAGNVAEQVCHRLRSAAVSHLSRVQTQSLYSSHSAEYVSRLSNDLTMVRTLLATELITLIRAPLQFAAAFTYMLLVSWRITLLSMAVMPLLMALVGRISRPITAQSQAVQEELGRLTVLSQDAVTGALVTKSFNLQSVLADAYRRASAGRLTAALRMARTQANLQGASSLVSGVPALLLFGLGGYEVIAGRLTLGGVMVLLNLSGNLSSPLQAVTRSWGRLQATAAAVARIAAIQQLPTERTSGGAATPTETGPALALQDIAFSYEDGYPVLQRFNLQIEPGEMVAIVGQSGAGKSTLFSLLLGLLEPTAGAISILGQPAGELSLPLLRGLFCYVPQDPTLFAGSVRDNIRLGRPEADDQAVETAARRAYAHDFIAALGDGYDTSLGEDGQGLSGGQKQRIALARAFLQDAPILLLDEPTSALDNESEVRIQLALDHLRVGRTLLVAAHRLSTIQSADRIVVIDRGSVVEQGTHQELLQAAGLYAALYRKQLTAVGGLAAVGE